MSHGVSWPEAVFASVFIVCVTLAYLGRMGALPWQVVYDEYEDDETAGEAGGLEVSHDGGAVRVPEQR